MPTSVTTPSLTGAVLDAKRSSSTAGPGGSLGKNEFLKLLTTQLRYQDPLDPMDGKNMAAELAQFSGLEQLLNINEQLEAQKGQYDALATSIINGQAMNMIGKTVVVESDKVLLAKDAKGVLGGQVTADITTSGNATLTLYDKSGREVGTRSLGYVGLGRQQFDVGTAASGAATEGAYAFRVTIEDPKSGKDMPQKTYTVGKIDGLSYGEDGRARLNMGPLVIDLGAIIEILS